MNEIAPVTDAFRLIDADPAARPIHLVPKSAFADWLADRPAAERAWIAASRFKPEPEALLLLPGSDGAPAAALAIGGAAGGLDGPATPAWALAQAAATLPDGAWHVVFHASPAADRDAGPGEAASAAALAWALGCYGFRRYKQRPAAPAAAPSLVWPDQADRARVLALAEATTLARDLINTPAGDLGPAELAAAAHALADRHGADFRQVIGEDLLAQNWPMVHAVGRASTRPPRLVELNWGDPAHPLIALVGKGVCFDSGGLDLKTASGMFTMKKDMGGAATLLALAGAVMALKVKVRLRVLLPAVENMVAGNAFHPADVLPTRKGLTVEVGNTDAEGRLILADALAEADTAKPVLLIDCATLTGAARVAVGPELPALFSRHDGLADQLLAIGRHCGEPFWRLPLWPGYRRVLDSKIADLSSTGETPYAGSSIAALFLAEFVSAETPWLHIDHMAWNVRARPGRPEGGEPQGLRALLGLIEKFAVN